MDDATLVMIFLGILMGIVTLIGAVIGAALGAVLLRYVCQWILKVRPTYASAYAATFLVGLCNIAIYVGAGMAAEHYKKEISWIGHTVLWLVASAFTVWITSRVLRHPETGPIGVRKSLVLFLVPQAVVIPLTAAIEYLAPYMTV